MPHPVPFGNALLIQRCDDIRANEAPPDEEALARVRRLVEGQDDAETLLQMLGLEPYESAVWTRGCRHGTAARYREYGCRCDPCKAAGRARIRRAYERLRAGHTLVKTHNRWGYQRGCRCWRCREDWREYERTRHRALLKTHGLGNYRRGCRCDVCRAANTEASRRYRAARRTAA